MFSFLRGKESPRDTEELVKLHYKVNYLVDRTCPFHGRRVVTGLLLSLARKVEENCEPFRVCSSGRVGPVSMTYWLEPLRRSGMDRGGRTPRKGNLWGEPLQRAPGGLNRAH